MWLELVLHLIFFVCFVFTIIIGCFYISFHIFIVKWESSTNPCCCNPCCRFLIVWESLAWSALMPSLSKWQNKIDCGCAYFIRIQGFLWSKDDLHEADVPLLVSSWIEPSEQENVFLFFLFCFHNSTCPLHAIWNSVSSSFASILLLKGLSVNTTGSERMGLIDLLFNPNLKGYYWNNISKYFEIKCFSMVREAQQTMTLTVALYHQFDSHYNIGQHRHLLTDLLELAIQHFPLSYLAT